MIVDFLVVSTDVLVDAILRCECFAAKMARNFNSKDTLARLLDVTSQVL